MSTDELQEALKLQKPTKILPPGPANFAVLTIAPFLLPLLGMLLVGVVFYINFPEALSFQQFMTVSIYLIVVSMILTGLHQHSLTQYVNGALMTGHQSKIVGHYHALLLVQLPVAAVFGFILIFFALPNATSSLWVMILSCFVLLNMAWLIHQLLIALKQYNEVFIGYGIGYGFILVLGFVLHPLGMMGLFGALLLGNLILNIFLHCVLYYRFPSHCLIDFSFVSQLKRFWPYFVISFFFYSGIWVDKLMLWLSPDISEVTIGRLSTTYGVNMPLMITYLASVPILVILVVRVKNELDRSYQNFIQAMVSGETLHSIEHWAQTLKTQVWRIFGSIFKTQFLALLVLVVLTDGILQLFSIASDSILKLFIRNASLSVTVFHMLFIVCVDLLIYLNKRTDVVWLCIGFFVANTLLSWFFLNHVFIVEFWGTGLGVSAFLFGLLGLWRLLYHVKQLSYEAFMFASF